MYKEDETAQKALIQGFSLNCFILQLIYFVGR